MSEEPEVIVTQIVSRKQPNILKRPTTKNTTEHQCIDEVTTSDISDNYGTFSIDNEAPTVGNDIIVVNLSSDDEEEISNNVNQTGNKNVFTEIENGILGICEAPCEEVEYEMTCGDDILISSMEASQQSYIDDMLHIESDEDYEFTNFPGQGANNGLRAAANNQLKTKKNGLHFNRSKDKYNLKTISLKYCNEQNVSVSNTDEFNNESEDSEPDPNIPHGTFITSHDNETLNSFVQLICPQCYGLESLDNRQLDNMCLKCNKKFLFKCKICSTVLYSLSLIYTHLTKFHKYVKKYQEEEAQKTKYDVPEDTVQVLLQVHPNVEKSPTNVEKSLTVMEKSHIDAEESHSDVEESYTDVEECNTNEANDLRCKKCGTQYKLLANLKKHESKCQMSPNLHCKFCPTTMSFKRELRDHIIAEHADEFKLEDLEGILESIVKDGNKLRAVINMIMGYCSKCRCKIPLNLNQKKCRNCNSDLYYECGEQRCCHRFLTMQDLSRHVRKKHLERYIDLLCNICDRSFYNPETYIFHRLKCRGTSIIVPIYNCADCPYKAKTEEDLNAHVYEQHRVMDFTACEERKDEDAPFECTACYKTFKQNRWLVAHQRNYCDKFFQLCKCAHCNYKTFNKERLEDHIRCAHIHVFTGRLFKCIKCGTRWSSIYKLNSHLGECSGDYAIEIQRQKQKRRRSRPAAKSVI